MLDGPRLNKILRARGIRGVIVVGLMRENRLPGSFCRRGGVSRGGDGRSNARSALSFACTDHHMLALRAFQKALELGYKRPALVLDRVIDRLVDGRFSAGVQIAQQALPVSCRARPFYLLKEARDNRRFFAVGLKERSRSPFLRFTTS